MCDVAVLGDGIPELAAALELAEVGLRVRIYPTAASGAQPGTGPLTAPAGAWDDAVGISDPDGTLRDFLAHVAAPLTAHDSGAFALAESVEPRTEAPVPPLLRGAKGAWGPLPQPAVVGVPAVPLSADALALLGGRAAARAALDRIRPVLTIGKAQSFGSLVQARLGTGARERLVEPLVQEAYGVAAEAVDAAIAAPGLNEALTRVGTLSGAALDLAERYVARETRVAPAGGWEALRAALDARLRLYTVDFAAEPAGTVAALDEGWAIVSSADESERTEARAIVLGVPEDLEPRAATEAVDASAYAADLGTAATALEPLLGRPRRVLGRVGIVAPDLPAPQQQGPALELVTLASGERWTVRLEPGRGAGSDAWEARVLGPSLPSAGSSPAALPADAGDRVLEAVRAAGQQPRPGVAAVSMQFAPYVAVAEREAAQGSLNEWCESHPEELPVGVALHGGDLADAIADARQRAVALRRRLAGIAD